MTNYSPKEIDYNLVWRFLRMYYNEKQDKIPLGKYYYKNSPRRVAINNTQRQFDLRLFNSKDEAIDWLRNPEVFTVKDFTIYVNDDDLEGDI